MAKKHYVLDTNILLQSPKAIFGFDDNSVYITSTTLQELDSKKTLTGEIGYGARETARIIEHLMAKGDIIKGVAINDIGSFRILTDGISASHLLEGYSLDRADNRIISACKALQDTVSEPVVLVTNDTMMRINAAANRLDAQAYKNDHVDEDNIYKGIRTIETEDWQFIDDLCKHGRVEHYYDIENPSENEFFILKSGNMSALAMYRNGAFEQVRDQHAMKIKARNVAQTFALRALLAPPEEIPFVVLKGAAGTAKTFLSLAAGLEHAYHTKNYRTRYNQIYITRANQLADADFGYLPGDLSDKMRELINPFTDNLEVILRGDSNEENDEIQMQIDDLFSSKIIRLLPLSYIRGRSISNSYIIVDEAQNCSAQLMRDVVTRLGQGSKLVVLGDPSQCDNHILDSRNNGLVYVADKFHKANSKLCAQITFDDEMSVRSALATEALSILN